MRKLKLLSLAAVALLPAGAWAQTDVTDTYITNPSFETDGQKTWKGISDNSTVSITGWTTNYQTPSSSYEDAGLYDVTTASASGFGTLVTPADGTYYYFNRRGWGNVTNTLTATSIKNLSVGRYLLIAKFKAAYTDSKSLNNAVSVTISAKSGETTLGTTTSAGGPKAPGNSYFVDSPWEPIAVAFDVTEAASVDFVLSAYLPGSNGRGDVLWDDVKLYDISSASVSNPADFTGYIKNHSFETTNTNGWTVLSGSDKGAKQNSNSTYTTSGVHGNYVFNIWGGSAPYKVSQTVSGLPDGYYKLTALVASDQYQNIQVYCGNGKVYDYADAKGTGKDITTAVAYVSDGSMEIGATSYSWFKTDNFRLYYLGTDYEASSENPLAVTDKASLAWNVSGTTVQWGIQLRETYSAETTEIIQNDRLTQTITGLDNGTYRVKLWAEASHANDVAGETSEGGTTVAQLYANGVTANVGLTTQNSVAGGTLDLYTIDTEVTDKTLKIGMNAIANGANWHIIQIENLLYTGPLDLTSYQNAYDALVAEAGTAKTTYAQVTGKELTDLNAVLDESFDTTSPDAYDDINGRLRTLIDAFVAAAPKYDLLATEKTKAAALGMTADAIAEAAAATMTGIDALHSLKVAEYNYVIDTYNHGVELSNTAWKTVGNTADNKGQHWDGGGTSTYKEQMNSNGTPKMGWDASSWTIGFSYDITLPAGKYVFKVAGRKASGNGSTLSLNVTKTSDSSNLGSVADFPEGDTGLGINKDGVTSFDPSDATGFANNNNGRGWEWRYVPFELTEETDVSIAVDAEATTEHQWISFCNYTLQTDDEAVVKYLAYKIALDDAKEAIADETYINVTGTEKTALQAAIDADETLDKTSVETLTTATTTLTEATAAFTAAKAAYDGLVAAKAVSYADDLPYASATKYAAIATAQTAEEATTAADATSKTNAILSAYRKYVESNALAEGVAGTENKTSLIADPNMDVTYDGTNHTFGAWAVIGQTNGAIQLLTSESFTDGDGNSNYKYADVYKNDNNAGIQQTVNLEPGRYLLTVTARANNTAGAGFRLFAGGSLAEISRIGNTGGTFNRGWNDKSLEFAVTATSDVNIGVQAYNGKDLWWSATRFRLVKLPAVAISEKADYTPAATVNNVTLTRTIKADTWNTFCVPFAISNAELKAAFGDGVAVAEFSETPNGDNSTINFNTMAEPAIAANTPVLLKTSVAGTEYVFSGRTIETGDAVVNGTANFNFVGTYAATTTVQAGDYFIGQNKLWASDGNTTIAGTRAYIKAATTGARITGFTIDDEQVTAIDGIELGTADGGKTFNLAGQQVTAPAKGLYIRNGKKVVVR